MSGYAGPLRGRGRWRGSGVLGGALIIRLDGAAGRAVAGDTIGFAG